MERDEQFYRRFLDGDKDGLTELVRMYREGLTIYINRIIGDIGTAEELMEDTFVKLYADKPKFRGKSTFRTWLFSIARNTAVDYIRKSSRLRTVSEDAVGELSAADDIEKGYIKEEDKIKLHEAMEQLNSDYRQVLWLVFFEQFTNAEAAAIMKRSDKQFRDLLYNAKKALKTELERRGFEYEGL